MAAIIEKAVLPVASGSAESQQIRFNYTGTDVLGNEVSTLISEKRTHGAYEVNWDASNYPSGVCFYKLTVGEQSIEKKMALIK